MGTLARLYMVFRQLHKYDIKSFQHIHNVALIL